MEQIQIDSLTPDFLGVGIAPNGKKVSYPYTLPGDILSVEFSKKKSRPGRYRFINFLNQMERSTVKCEHFSECGGCAGQHILYEDQCNLKFSPIKKLFSETLNLDFDSQISNDIYHYRSRMDFSVFPGPTIGLRARGNFKRVINVKCCFIQSEWANEELTLVRQLVNEFSHFPWDRRDENGGLKYVTLRKAKFTEDNMSILTFTDGFSSHIDFENFKNRTLQLLSAKNIIFCFNRVKSEVSASGNSIVIRGMESYRENILGINFMVPFDSFFQPNPLGFLPILNFITTRLPEKKTSLTDLFCGNGFFASIFGSSFSKINCYELTPSSIEIAKKTLSTLFPGKEIHADVVNLFQDTSKLTSDPDGVLILDPPRAGAGASVNQWIAQNGPKDLFYVSCNPYSQAEDLRHFISEYEPISSLLIDPYPHTPHCESVIHLRRKTKAFF